MFGLASASGRLRSVFVCMPKLVDALTIGQSIRMSLPLHLQHPNGMSRHTAGGVALSQTHHPSNSPQRCAVGHLDRATSCRGPYPAWQSSLHVPACRLSLSASARHAASWARRTRSPTGDAPFYGTLGGQAWRHHCSVPQRIRHTYAHSPHVRRQPDAERHRGRSRKAVATATEAGAGQGRSKSSNPAGCGCADVCGHEAW